LAAPFLFRGKNVRDCKTNFDLTGYLPDHRDQRSVTLFCIEMPKPILARNAEPFSQSLDTSIPTTVVSAITSLCLPYV
jgi:hypothetical protein